MTVLDVVDVVVKAVVVGWLLVIAGVGVYAGFRKGGV